MGYAMGIDIGSTSIKAHVYDVNGNVKAKGSIPTPLKQQYPDAHPTWYIWDPAEIWDCVCAAVRQALAQLSADNVDSVAVTGFGFDGVPMKNSGEALYPFISWHCNRNTHIYEEKCMQIGMRNIFESIGRPAFFYDTVYRLEWIKRNAPEIYENMDKWLYIEDYVNYRLSGIFATDYTMADCSSVFPPSKLMWDAALMRRAGVREDIWPDAYRSKHVLGSVTVQASAQTGLTTRTKVILGGHDYNCAMLAVGATEPDVIMDVTGTWEMLCLASPEIRITDELYESGIYIDNHVVDNRVVYMSAQVSGDMTEWMKNNLSGEELQIERETGVNVWKSILDRAEASPLGSNGVFFQPFFSGSSCPVIDKRALGAFVGMSNINTKNDMVRALFEGLNYLFRHTVEMLKKVSNAYNARIVATGGATKNTFWMQNKADVTGLMLETPAIEEATTLGTAVIAFLGMGAYRDCSEAYQAVYKKGRVYEPDLKKTEQYTELFEKIYKKIQPALAEVNHRIFDRFKVN